MFFSIVVPLYNRPQEMDELLDSLTRQVYQHFEVLIVEDGSRRPAEHLLARYQDRLDLHYFRKENEGQGFARNYGFARAKGDYFIVFDSDVLVPENYLQTVLQGIQSHSWDAFGGPDAAHPSFSALQKAISYSMTSPFTTGGIRGNKQHVGQFHPRSFNMGISRKTYEQTGGFKLSRQSEDIEFSIRMIEQGLRVGLIPEAFVYHKRRSTLAQFFKQTYNFGKGRIVIYRLFPKELKAVHALPAVFVLGLIGLLLLNLLQLSVTAGGAFLGWLCYLGNSLLSLYIGLLFLHAWYSTKNLKVALLALASAFTQLCAYGLGFLTEMLNLKK